MQSKQHWEHVYSTRATDAVSWYQEHADLSIRLIEQTGLSKDAAIIDVGGGASTLVDDLLAGTYSNLTVLDVSAAALSAAQERLRTGAAMVKWIEADITCVHLASNAFDLWHDRAAFHFLTSPEQRAAYIENAVRALKHGGYLIIATFAEGGPVQCSGLPVVRYTCNHLRATLGPMFTLVQHQQQMHHTPTGATQPFTYCCFRKVGQ
jgi:ubiquinone/menaquinone biosynthesis C-methylase UbiE